MILASPLRAQDSPVENADLEDWVRRSRMGDLDAFNRIVERYYERTYRLAFRVLGDREAAEDATQEVFVKAWNGIAQFRGAARFTTWLHAVAVNHCLDAARQHLRHRQRTQSTDDEASWDRAVLIGISSYSTRRAGWDERLALREALARLPEKLRVVVALRYYSDYSLAEVAEALALPLNTIRSRLYLAMNRLRKELEEP